MATVATTCPYCGVGCGVLIETAAGRIVAVRGDPDHPANRGRLCTKGASLAATLGETGRVLEPELRRTRAEPRTRIGWNDALDVAAERFDAIIGTHGPDAVGFYVSGQLLTEDYVAFNRLARGVVGTNNIDTNSRLCMASAASGYKLTLGADAPPPCYDDIDHADCLFIAGSNAAWAHPVLFRRIEAAKAANPAMKIIVVDPRRTETADAADLHLAITPGTDVALMNAMLHVIVWEDLVDVRFVDAHTRGFADTKALVREFTPRAVAGVCGVHEEDIVGAARMFARSKATLSLYCQGLNQSAAGTAKNVALINLHLASGQIGRIGAGPFSLTGQPNAMGGREAGGMATTLPGHRDVADAEHRAEIASIWRVGELPSRSGLAAVELFEAAADGAVRALWIACTNPAQSLPDLRVVRRALERAEFVVVQEAFATETTAFADLLLPAATWGEKEGTVTNSERRISRVRRAVEPPGMAWPDWRIAIEFGRRLAKRLACHRASSGAAPDFESAEELWNEHRATTIGRDLDIGGLSYAILDRDGPQQWPYRAGARTGMARLYENGVFATPDGRARFVPTPYAAVADPIDARFPLRLTTGRLRDQWHGMSRTGRTSALAGHVSQPRLALNVDDMALAGLRAGDWAFVASRRGRIAVPVEPSRALRRGHAYMPMHWGSHWLFGPSGEGGVNELTIAALDPHSRQPELKHAAVRVEPARFAWQGWWIAAAGNDENAALARVREAARGLGYAIVGFAAGPAPGVVLHAAADIAPSAARLAALDALFGVAAGGCGVLRYDDARSGVARAVRVDGARLTAAALTGDVRSHRWLCEMLTAGTEVGRLGHALLRGGDAPPIALAERGPVICQCANVAASAIEAALPAAQASDDAVRALGAALGCGTHCGSCLPELRRLAAVRGERRAPVVPEAPEPLR